MTSGSTACFFGECCLLDLDPKNPNRWKPTYLIRHDIKNTILQTCKERSDEWAEEVQLRISGAISGLHAENARYHVHCYNRFRAPKFVMYAYASSSTKD